MLNGCLTRPFDVKSGVRQGCPLSPLIFVCAIELLLCYLQNDKSLKGVFVPGSGGDVVKSVCYMDDVTIVCSSKGGGEESRVIVKCFWLHVWTEC